MKFSSSVRFSLLAGVGLILALVAASSGLDGRSGPVVYAQAEATATALAARTPVPSTTAVATPGATALPAAPAETAAAPTSGGSMTASLGGSDIAVSSVGGSYEVDGPKRKAKKAAKLTPTP